MQAAERQQQRESQRYLRELERLARQHVKLTEMEQARLEVETWDSRLEVLLSVHKSKADPWDWRALSAALPPPRPQRTSHHEYRARQLALVAHPVERHSEAILLEQARTQDEQGFQQATKAYTDEQAEWQKLKDLARRVLDQDDAALSEVLTDFCQIPEITDLGTSFHFTPCTMDLVECKLSVCASRAIPTQTKTLTSTGKVSVKPMPKARFHEIHEDYVCGCMLRVAREAFAIVPIDTLLMTASTDILDAAQGPIPPQPVFSAILSRAIVTDPDFGSLNPSEAMDNLLHRGDFKASRKTGDFKAVTPLLPADAVSVAAHETPLHQLVINAKARHVQLKSMITMLFPDFSSATPIPPEA